MKTEYVNDKTIGKFIEYCSRYSREHDESFVPKEDFCADKDNPSYILLDDNNEIAGAVSLMTTPELRKQNRGRFRIMHCVMQSFEAYELMLDTIMPHAEGLDYVTLYLPEGRKAVAGYVRDLGFETERYSWYMEKICSDIVIPAFPEGYKLEPMRRGLDEQAWCDVTNRCFSSHPGHVDMTVELFLREINQEDYIDGGLMMLWYGSNPVGAVRVSRDVENGVGYAFITYVSVLEAHQGKGLGKNLIRAALQFSKDMGFGKAGLVVSASNKRAADIYINEGFKKIDTVACFKKHLKCR